jgi:hypothetical protein
MFYWISILCPEWNTFIARASASANKIISRSSVNYIKCIGSTTKKYAEIISEYVVIGRLSLWIVFKQIQSSQLTNSRKCLKLDYCTLSTCNRCSILTLRIHRYIDKGKYCILLIMSEKKLIHIICWEGRWLFFYV